MTKAPSLRPGNDPLTRDDIRAVAYAFQKSRILLTAYELGLFSAIGDRWRTSLEIASSLGTAHRATERLMNALCAIGLLIKERDRFANTASSQQFLVKGAPDYLAGLMHTTHLWNSWSTMTEAVRQGTSVAHHDISERGDVWLAAFIAAMHERASAQAPSVVGEIDLAGVSRVLDVGGGSGAFAMAFVRASRAIGASFAA
jgi:hypothetical protein